MKKLPLMLFPLFLALVLLLTSPPVHAAPQVTITPSGAGVFILQGNNFANIGGIKVSITYDQATLKNPRVEKGSLVANAPGSMFIPNPNTPGQVVIAAIQASGAFTGSGPIAIITFDRIGGSPGKITNLAVDLVEQQGEQSRTVAGSEIEKVITNPEEPAATASSGGYRSESSSGSQPIGGSTGQTVASGPSYLGTVTMPNESAERQQETSRREARPEPVMEQSSEPRAVPRESDDGAPSPQEEQKPAGEKKFLAYKSLIDQVRELKEEKTSKSLLSLFEKFAVPGVQQEPPVAISDGKTKVKVLLEMAAVGKESPNFALKGAKLVSLTNDEKNKWVIEMMPSKNANDVKITVLQNNVMTEIPLVVAQPLPATAVAKDGKLDAAALDLFFKERGTEAAPKFDVTGDGVRNYLDDYVVTANYLVKNPIKKKVQPDLQKKPEEQGKSAVKPPQKK